MIDIRISKESKTLYYKIRSTFPNIIGTGENKFVIYAYNLQKKKKVGKLTIDSNPRLISVSFSWLNF